jgi:transcriptional regulator with XRE-family HTH domain
MPRSQSAAISRRRLRSSLRTLRTQRSLTQKDVAEALRWSPAKLMRIEAGKVGLTFTDLQALLREYGITEKSDVDGFIGLLTNARSASGISVRYREVLSKEFAEFVEHEEEASIIRNFQPNLIPGPLQTHAYAAAVLANLPENPMSDTAREKRIQLRLERAALLTQEGGPQAFFLIDESAILRNVGAESGNTDLMAAQLDHLKELGSHPNITIQLLPLSVGLYPGLPVPFVILEFDDEFDDRLVYLEGLEDSLIIRDDIERVARIVERFQSLEQRATAPNSLDSALDQALARLREAPTLLH